MMLLILINVDSIKSAICNVLSNLFLVSRVLGFIQESFKATELFLSDTYSWFKKTCNKIFLLGRNYISSGRDCHSHVEIVCVFPQGENTWLKNCNALIWMNLKFTHFWNQLKIWITYRINGNLILYSYCHHHHHRQFTVRFDRQLFLDCMIMHLSFKQNYRSRISIHVCQIVVLNSK